MNWVPFNFTLGLQPLWEQGPYHSCLLILICPLLSGTAFQQQWVFTVSWINSLTCIYFLVNFLSPSLSFVTFQPVFLSPLLFSRFRIVLVIQDINQAEAEGKAGVYFLKGKPNKNKLINEKSGSCCEEDQAGGMDGDERASADSTVREGLPKEVALELRLELWGNSHRWWGVWGKCDSSRGTVVIFIVCCARSRCWELERTCCLINGRAPGFHPGSGAWSRYLAFPTLRFLVSLYKKSKEKVISLTSLLALKRMCLWVCHIWLLGGQAQVSWPPLMVALWSWPPFSC